MSLGALSKEAHETLAVAMNRLGGMSNSGEGGEDPSRNTPDPNGDERRSRIRQVASGRFGVDVDYLSRADQLQIKVAQGAKPGEGGQLPGHKVDTYIASLRHSTPGVELISPPPHHDIYSIEDLKQLIYDLRAANPTASVSVKLAAEAGVGTVAAGVVKAGADHIVIAGHDGGTGASPQSSIQQAGVPWELGLAETQQALLDSELRSRVVLQADGQMRTGRDVVIAALLGADEVGLSTAPLIATGCIMMRVCHLNTCPVGVASQDPELRTRFKGTPEQVVTYMIYVAEEARQLMAALGIGSFEELVGKTHLLNPSLEDTSWKTAALDLRPLLAVPPMAEGRPKGFVKGAGSPRGQAELRPSPAGQRYRQHEGTPDPVNPVRIDSMVVNSDLTVGGSLSNAVVSDHGPDGLPEDSIQIQLRGSAGQSCGAWLASGITLKVEGDVNDYAGKGLSGGVLAVHPAGESHFAAADNVIAGNVTLYGATRGRAFFSGRVGERFAVRNSGALAVVEGVGEHACEYMTGGCVVVIGPTGQNFGAGMSGGVAFVHNPDGTLGGADQPPARRSRSGQRRPRAGPAGAARRAPAPDRLGGGARAARSLAGRGRGVHPGDPARLQGGDGADGRRARAAHRRRSRSRGGGGRLMADPKGFLKVHRVPAPERDPAERVRDYEEIYLTLPEDELREQAIALHGLRGSLLQRRLPARQPDPRLERPGADR